MSRKEKILIVDDCKMDRRKLEKFLVEEGYETLACSSGKEALEELVNFPAQLIILDLIMPDMNGFEVITRLKQHPETQNIPVIFFTGSSSPDHHLSAYVDYGANYYMTKPLSKEEVLSGIDRVLQDFREVQESGKDSAKQTCNLSYVVFEGIEGSGKSTIVKGVLRSLLDQGIDAIVTKEPGATDIGKMLRDLLLLDDFCSHALTEAFLFAADRAEHLKRLFALQLRMEK